MSDTLLPKTIVPIRDPDRRFTTWDVRDIYTGGKKGKGQYVPNVGDTVIDKTGGDLRVFDVVFVDESTLLSDLVEVLQTGKNQFSRENQMLGIGPGYQSESWRLFLDTSVVPHVFIPDSRLTIYGTTNTKYKIFAGTDTSKTTGKVISMNFNANGELISEDIPLEKVAFAADNETDTNIAVKCCRKGYTTERLQNGEVVTLVTYTDAGEPTSKNVLLVHNTALDRNVEGSKKYITTIGIESPFLDKTENNTLVYPINTPYQALAIMGIVTYSDGSIKRIPIDGARMVLSGFDNYVPTKATQNINLVLTYHMTDDEMALNSSVGRDRFISVKYFGRTQHVDGSYTVNIFPIPTYLSEEAGWKMRYMLYTLDRDMAYDVTSLVQAGANSLPFNPMLYGETQSLTVALDLQKVDVRLKPFRHVQSYKIALMGKPSPDNPTAWYITYEKDQNPNYGANIVCKAVRDPGRAKWTFDITCGAKQLDEWLDRVYYRTLPLYDRFSEVRPLKPTHFTIFIDNESRTYPIKAWNTPIEFPVGAQDGYGVIVTFTRVDGANEYQLGASPICFMDISEGGVNSHASIPTIKPSGDGSGNGPQGGNTNNANASTLIDIEAEVRRIVERGANDAIADKYRTLLQRIKENGLLKYEVINKLFQRIRNDDITPAMIANDVILLEMEIAKNDINKFNNRVRTDGISPVSMTE